MKKSLTIFAVLLLAILAACSDSSDTTASKKSDNQGVQEKSSEESKGQDEIPDINEEAMNQAYDTINDYDMVKDSYIKVSKKDKKLF